MSVEPGNGGGGGGDSSGGAVDLRGLDTGALPDMVTVDVPAPDVAGEMPLADEQNPPDLPVLPDVVDVVEPPEVSPDVPQPYYASGHWGCQPWAGSTKCVPLYESITCGNGACNPFAGESQESCPADCTAQPQQECADVADCIFLDWPLGGNGYWQCEWVGWGDGFECQAVGDPAFCDTQQGFWCAEEWGESASSCPQDCAAGNLDPCETPLDCVFLEWPLKLPE